MNLITQSPKKALKAFLKQKPLRSEIDVFKINLIALLNKIDIIEKRPKDESEEHLKNDLRDFLRDTYYRDNNAINTKDKKDLVIHIGKTTSSDVGVIIEAKRPANTSEMISPNNFNKKALRELILYYLDERNQAGNNQLKKLVITNINEWYIIDANYFDKHIYRNIQIKKLYETYINDKKDKPFFYEEVSKIIPKIEADIPCVYFDIREYNTILRNNKKDDDKELSALLKILSPQHLLKIAAPNDGNSLNEKFYKELLHIIGLEEAKENGKNIIRRKKQGRNPASLIETTIDSLNTEDVLHRLPDQSIYGENKEERIFNIALELCITWINRILFLKLLEGQLETYHQGDKSFRFLNNQLINDFDELFKLFHKVLAIPVNDRSDAVKDKYFHVPYLNSSLFEISELEDQTIKINSLDNGGNLELINSSILREIKKTRNSLPILDYLFQFLDAYDFASEGTDEVQEDNKTIINASVLGKVFEKINGYKDGSIFTPAFITMYMCEKSIRSAVIEKFNDALSEKGEKLFDNFKDLRNYTRRLFKAPDILKANEIINTLRICDPAVGSGHFLVSALNEIIQIKAELGILADFEGNSISNYEFDVVNDELIITDPKANLLAYKLKDGKPLSKDIQHLQKTLFHEKQIIIEDCLFGVDINPNSVKICRLRLWIELLKNAYYKEESGFSQLETLPNIDINIKCGNSLVSRFKLKDDEFKNVPNFRKRIAEYTKWVNDYKNVKDRDKKRDLSDNIKLFTAEFKKRDPKVVDKESQLKKLLIAFNDKYIVEHLFEIDQNPSRQQEKEAFGKRIEALKVGIDQIKNNPIYKNAFEWRFEFPEVLSNDGEFKGFDLIIGNPPYIQLQKLSEDLKKGLEQQQFKTFAKTGDIYQLFYEHGLNLLKTKGHLSYITSNKWMRTDYGESTRAFLSSQCNTTLVVDFGMKQIFESATTYTNMLFLQKVEATPTIKMCRVNDSFDINLILEDYIDYLSLDIENPGGKSWISYEKAEYELIKKIISKGTPLKEWDVKINYGLKTGYNDAFVIDTETRDRLVSQDSKSATLIKPLLRGEDIKAYLPKWAGLWVIGTFPALNITLDDYPAVKNYLLPFKERLEPKPKKYDEKKQGKWKGRKSGSYKWFETQDSISYYEDFLKPKIIYPNMTKYMPFVYDKHQFFTNDKSFILTGFFLEYLTAFLNSKLFKFAFKDYFPELLGDTRELRKVFFENVTVKPNIDTTIFDEKLAQIEQYKLQNIPTLELEKEIDNAIFEHYDLTNSERILVDGFVSSSEFSERLINLSSSSLSE